MSSLTLVVYIVVIVLLIYDLVMAGDNDADDSVSAPENPNGAPQRRYVEASPRADAAASKGVLGGPRRVLGEYRDVTYDAASFDLSGAIESAKKAYTETPAPRTSSNTTGGTNSSIVGATGKTIVRPIVDNIVIPPAPIVTPPSPPVIAAPSVATERPDFRCGPSFGGAKCGPGRCCSIWGWCGSQGEPHCTPGINNPAYNGPSL